jgi:hypothetical protein
MVMFLREKIDKGAQMLYHKEGVTNQSQPQCERILLMKQLTSEGFAAAQAYLLNHARPLDQECFRFHFADGHAQAVLAELAKFQNPDGGFGHAIEPDMRAPASSAVATAHGCATLRGVAAAGNEPLVQGVMRYFVDTYDAERGVWPILTARVEEAPHAPWWTYADSDKNFGGSRSNPTASIVGYLYDYPELTPGSLLAEVTPLVLARLDAAPDLMEMHDLQCYLVLAEARQLPADLRRRVQEKLRRAALATIEPDPQKWSGYGLPPLDVASSPASFLADNIDRRQIEANLDFVIEQQLPDGSWPVPWSWAFVDETAWAQAERDWKGQMIVNKLRVLQAFGRIEGS